MELISPFLASPIVLGTSSCWVQMQSWEYQKIPKGQGVLTVSAGEQKEWYS